MFGLATSQNGGIEFWGCIKCLVLADENIDGIRPLLGGVLEKEGGSTPQHLMDALLFLP